MELDLPSLLKTRPLIALVGATNHSEKYGNIILRDMKKKGFRILPVNPKATTVDEEKSWHSLTEAAAENEIGLVVFVVPPKITLSGLQEALSLGLKKVWIQPGAGDESVRAFLDTNGFQYLMNACVMVQAV